MRADTYVAKLEPIIRRREQFETSPMLTRSSESKARNTHIYSSYGWSFLPWVTCRFSARQILLPGDAYGLKLSII